MPLEPSPTARALLECARRGALSAVSIGDSRLTFNGGRLVAVQGADAGLLAFLVRAGTLTPRDAREFDSGEDDDVLSALRERLGGNVLRRARRAAWIDRLVAVLDSDSPLSPASLGPVASTLQGEMFIPILLDALARRAGNRDAGMVGAHAELVFVWRLDESEADLSEARRWLTYDPPEDESLARLLVRHPGAAPRLAALARAGFASFLTAEESAQTPRSALPSLGRASLAPARPPLRQLTPGATVPPPSLAIHDIKLPLFATQSAAPLEDPLFDIESRITFLEAMNAPGPDRAEAWAASGEAWLQIHGALDEACRAYREAAAADPTDTTALLQSARLCIATGQRELARAYASSATSVASDQTSGECRRFEAKLALQSGERERAADLLRDHLEIDTGDAEVWAFLALETGDPQLCAKAETILGGGGLSGINLESELRKAELLVRGGHPESAIHRLREAADAASDIGLARAMRLEAAEHAEFIRRPDLAFALLFDAFVRDASIEVLYEPLAHDAMEASEPELRAVLLERFATLTSGTVASSWFLKAAKAFAALPGHGRLWSHELTIRALEADPASADALEALTTSADDSRDANILADGLERAAIRADDVSGVPLFERLAGLAEARLGSVHRAAWAWRMVHARTGREDAGREALRLGEKAAVRSSLLRLAEEDLENADSETRPAAVRRLAAMLRDHPEQRIRAAALYREYLSGHPDDRSAAEALRRLLALSGDPEARLSSLLDQHDRVSTSTDRDRLLDELTGLLALHGRWSMLATRAQDWCAGSPSNHVAIARFELAARLVGSPPQRKAARDARLQAPQRATHAPLWVERAREAADGDVALGHLNRALAIDPRCVPALIDGALLEHGSPADQWERIQAARHVAPTDPVLLARAIDMSREHRPDFLAELMRVAEGSPNRVRQRPPERFDAACESGDVDRAMHALDAWLASISRPSGMRIVTGARLMAKTHPDDAARILVRATDQTSDPRLLSAADEYARDDETRGLILERRVIWDDDFAHALRELAHLRRNARRTPSEARTLLRILADDPSDQPALTRLSEIYGECGEYERLYAIHALQRNASRGAAERERASIAMAVIAYRHLREPARARSAMEDLAADPASTETAAAVLSKLGDHRSAIDLLVRRADSTRREHPTLAQRWVVTAVAIAETLLSSRPIAIEVASEALKRGVRGADLMLLFEKLTLREKDRETAMAVYDHLRKVAMGPHGRRGTTYRCARWLERLGDERAALQSYQAAFHDDPGDGVILSSIERLARRSGQLVVWADALRALADRQTHVDHRLRVERRLVALLDLDMGDPSAALDRLTGVWEDTQKSELVPELRKLLQKIDSDVDRRAAIDRLVGGLRARIESTWNSDDQAATLGTLAELLFVEGNDSVAATKAINELGALLEDEEDIPRRFGADGYGRCATALLADAPDRAREYAEKALSFDHEHVGARRVIEELGMSLPEAPEEPSRHEDAMSFADLAEELGNDDGGPAPFAEAMVEDAPVAEEAEETVAEEADAEETVAEEADAEETVAEETVAEEAEEAEET
ncbi:MAG: tetratricopeptide (TPR) repeat protein, partial [Polyangiales bacterium]